MIEPEHWPGDIGDLPASLWYYTVGRIANDTIDTLCEALGIPSIRLELDDILASLTP